jgi:hypothetical protein
MSDLPDIREPDPEDAMDGNAGPGEQEHVEGAAGAVSYGAEPDAGDGAVTGAGGAGGAEDAGGTEGAGGAEDAGDETAGPAAAGEDAGDEGDEDEGAAEPGVDEAAGPAAAGEDIEEPVEADAVPTVHAGEEQDYGDQHRTAAVKIQSRVRGSQVRARGRGGRGDDGGGEGEGVAPEEAGQDEQDAARREVQGAEEVARKGTGWFFCTQTQPRKHHLICARGCGCHHAHQQLPPACCALTRLSLSPNPLLSCRKRMRPCLTSAASLLRHGMAGRSLSHMRGVEKAQATQARAWPRRRTATASPRTAEKTRLGLDPPPHRLPTSLKPTRRAGHPFSKGSLLLTACTRARCTVPPPGQQECPAEEWAYCQIQENGQEEPANRARAGAGNKQERESSPSSRE